MNALIHLLSRCRKEKENTSAITRLAKKMDQLGEPFWFALSFCLFLLMGPFSVFAVLLGLHKLASQSSTLREPDAV